VRIVPVMGIAFMIVGVVALFVFLLLRLTPGDPAAILAGDNATPEQLDRIRTSLGLNLPLYTQFFTWIGRLLQGDLGGLKFAIANGQKDLRYYTHLAESLPVPSFLGEAAHQSFVQATNLGYGDKFIASLFEAQEQTAKVSIVHNERRQP